VSLADSLERAASALPNDADGIRPANGDPDQLLASLDVEAAARVLAWLLVNEPEAGGEVAARWAESEQGAAPLASVDESGLPKAGRKGLRRALHRARSRGITIERPPASEPIVARLPEIADDIEAGFVSGLDPRGARIVHLLEPNP